MQSTARWKKYAKKSNDSGGPNDSPIQIPKGGGVMEIVPIKLGKAFREQLGWTHFVMFGIDENGIQHVVTHGENASDAKAR
jgi:hypothetical protein